VIEEDVPLMQRSEHRWQGVCPFEETPEKATFWVNPQKGLFYCFGCHVEGHVVRFVMLKHDITAPEAVAYLRERIKG
jgi:DNA primase